MKKHIARAAGLLLASTLMIVPSTSAHSLTESDWVDCPGGRYLVTSGNARGYVYVQAMAKNTSKKGASTLRQYASVSSGQGGGRQFWAVSSGDGDTEVPNAGVDCKIN